VFQLGENAFDYFSTRASDHISEHQNANDALGALWKKSSRQGFKESRIA
jgi:hypothetical protein